jgi:polyketide biosynthesis acyl carrier protein
MTQQDILGLIARHTGEVLPRLRDHAFERTDSLKDLGANSVDRSEIIMMTLESLAVRVPLIEMAKAKNIGELADIIHAKC